MSDSPVNRVISADSHVMEPPDLWLKAIGDKFGDRTPRLIDEHRGEKGSYFYTGGQIMHYGQGDASAQDIGMQEAGYVPEVRVRFQERAGVAAELLNATFMLLIMRHPDYDCLRACAAVFNDWLGEFAGYDAERLVGIGMIPMDDVDWAVKELERCAAKGFKCVNIHLYSPPGCPPYQNAAYDPFWARAQEIGMPVQLHIITGRVPDPLHFHTREEQSTTPKTQIEMMYEVMGVLANEFIFGKILDRFPSLKLLCGEFEISWIPPFMWRLDQMQVSMAARLPLPKLDMLASDYMRTRVWHGMIDDAYGAQAIRHIGTDQVLWGSDFPHIRSIGLDTQSRVGQMFADFEPADQRKLVGENAVRVFNL